MPGGPETHFLFVTADPKPLAPLVPHSIIDSAVAYFVEGVGGTMLEHSEDIAALDRWLVDWPGDPMDLRVAVDVTFNMSDYVMAFQSIAANGRNVASLFVNVTLGSTPCLSPVVELIDATLANVTCRAPVRALQRDALTLAAEQKRRLWARPDGLDRQDWASRLREARRADGPGMVTSDRRVAARLPVTVAVSSRGGRTVAATANATDIDQTSMDANADVIRQELVVWVPAPTMDLFNMTASHRSST